MSKRKQAAKKTPIQIKQSRPWGVIAGVTALVLFLAGILAYSVLNTGGGFKPATARADERVEGATDAELLTYDDPGNGHQDGVLEYEQSPPVGGAHNSRWQNCGVYTEQIPNEHAVHSLEHGAVWVTYRPDLPADQVQKLTDLVQGEPYGLLSPYPGLKSAVSLQAWGRQLFVESAEDPGVEAFFDAYSDGPQTPEKGAACSGGVSITGSTPVGVAPPVDTGTAPAPVATTGATAPAGATPSS